MKSSITTGLTIVALALSYGCAKKSNSSDVKSDNIEINKEKNTATIKGEFQEPLKKRYKLSQIAVNLAPKDFAELNGLTLFPYSNRSPGPCDISRSCEDINMSSKKDIFLEIGAKEYKLDIPLDSLPESTREKLLKGDTASIKLTVPDNDIRSDGGGVVDNGFGQGGGDVADNDPSRGGGDIYSFALKVIPLGASALGLATDESPQATEVLELKGSLGKTK